MPDDEPNSKPALSSRGEATVDQQFGGSGSTTVTESQRQPARRYIPLWNNTITILGLFGAAMALMLLVSFALFAAITPKSNPYVDIIGYLVLPSLLIVSLFTVPVGILFKSWRIRRRDPSQRLAFRFPRIDLNDPTQRRVAKWFVGGTFVMLPVVGVSAYHGYHFTDSTEFCAQACHAVMEPQATAYERSAHARVTCAECHIGSGAGWFVKSKLSGTRQVLAMWRESYSRPIPPAITELRPARETCERCHWPKKFFGFQLRESVHYASDENNTRREIAMLLKTGGGDESTGNPHGIHLHMALAGNVEYIATDEKLQTIPWVRLVNENGHELIYRSDGRPSSDARPEGQVRRLDCMDCHNRPAHKFRSPQESVDAYLASGMIDVTLPFIKRQTVAALIVPYPDSESAAEGIKTSIRNFYQSEYPELWAQEEQKAAINRAVDHTRDIYANNFFPRMKVDWRTYPDNIGHSISPGCFRCHEGKHVNQNGDHISSECSTCHDFLNPIAHNGRDGVIERGEFQHPFALVGRHAELRCDECHDGGKGPVPTCTGCHTVQAQFRAGSLAAFEQFSIPAEPMAEVVDCEACHDQTRAVTLKSVDAACMDCHEDEEDRFEGMLASWSKEVDEMMSDAESRTNAHGRELLQTLRKAGPLHNIEGTRLVIDSLPTGPESLTEEQQAD